jgi:hypothetical protein
MIKLFNFTAATNTLYLFFLSLIFLSIPVSSLLLSSLIIHSLNFTVANFICAIPSGESDFYFYLKVASRSSL